MATTILTIEDLVKEPKTVKINGVDYEILDPDDFGLLEQRGLYKTQEKVEALFKSDTTSALNLARKELDKFVRQIMPTLPTEVFDGLSMVNGKVNLARGDKRKLQIMAAFMKAVDASQPKPQDQDQTLTEDQTGTTPTEQAQG